MVNIPRLQDSGLQACITYALYHEDDGRDDEVDDPTKLDQQGFCK